MYAIVQKSNKFKKKCIIKKIEIHNFFFQNNILKIFPKTIMKN